MKINNEIEIMELDKNEFFNFIMSLIYIYKLQFSDFTYKEINIINETIKKEEIKTKI